MDALKKFKFQAGADSEMTALTWFDFLQNQEFDYTTIKEIDFTGSAPRIFDSAGNKFSIDFAEDQRNYNKKKATMKKELIGRAMGAGRLGIRILDLSAGLGIDAVFLCQLGFEVTALERNPLVFLALDEAQKKQKHPCKIHFIFGHAQKILQTIKDDYDVIYFDPMFPEKIKSALPRQEMVFFRKLVGSDDDAEQVLQEALKKNNVRRVVVKRPLKAPLLLPRPQSQLTGKLVRFDIYGASN